MKHNFTLGKLNLKYNDALISRIKYLKSKKTLKKIKLDENIVKTLSSNTINPEMKSLFFHSLKKINLKKNNYCKKKNEYSKSSFNNKTFHIPNQIQKMNYKYKVKSLSNKIINVNNLKKEKKYFLDDNIFDNNNFKDSLTFRKRRLNLIDSITLKINEDDNSKIFYNKENFLLVKPFNSINNQIRKKINEIIMKKKLKEKEVCNNTENNVNQNEIKINRNNSKSIRKTKIHLREIDKNIVSKITVEKKKIFDCVNCKISFPFFIKDNIIMNNFSKENYLEYKKYIETQ